MRSGCFSEPGACAPGPPLTLTSGCVALGESPLTLGLHFSCAQEENRLLGYSPRLTLALPHLLPDPSQP